MHSCQTPLAFFPGLLTWRVEWISQISVGMFLKNPWTTAALHLDSTCRESLDTVASLFIVVRLTITCAAFPLAEHIVYAWQQSRIIYSSFIRAPSTDN